MIAPEFVAFSDWGSPRAGGRSPRLLHRLRQHLAPNPDGTPLSAPIDIDRAEFSIGNVDGWLDVSRDTGCAARGRLFVSTDNPGWPNVQAALARYPIYTALAAPSVSIDPSTGCRFQPAPPSTAPTNTNSKLTDGTSSTNDDRNFSQYGGVGRARYDLSFPA